MHAVQRVGRVVERVYKADGLTIACQVWRRLSPPPPPPYRDTTWTSLSLTSANLFDLTSGQDGRAAGQTVPHLHVHILPRRLQGDRFAGTRNDVVYTELEKREGALPQDLASTSHTGSGSPEPLKVDADETREPRTLEDMEQEAKWLASFFDADE